MITAESTLVDVAFEVCTALHRAGVTAVLSGGGAATLHAPRAIQSYDLDFILAVYTEEHAPGLVLERLGFRRSGHDYVHQVSPYQLEFPPGPLAVGGERIEAWNTLRSGDRLLHVITPTDSCRDRLAAYYHFGDRSALEQAIAVQRSTGENVDLQAVREWSEREGMLVRFEEFLRLLPRSGE